MMARALPALQLDRHWPERLLLFLIQHRHDLVHVARLPRNRKALRDGKVSGSFSTA
jgi:hypothetical protein